MDRSDIREDAGSAPADEAETEPPSFGRCLTDSTLDHYGLTGLLGQGAVGAVSTPFPKAWIGARTAFRATPLSAFGHSLPTINRRVGVRILGTPRVFSILGRAMPGVGAGLLAYDAGP
jgi:hypothetical protein